MNILARFAVVVLILAAVLPAVGQQWFRVQSPNFVVISDTSDGEARRAALRLEEMQIAFGSIFHRSGKVSLPVHTIIFVLRSPLSLTRIAPEIKSAAPAVPTVHTGIERWFLNGLVLDGGDPWNSPRNENALREVALLMLEDNYPSTPAWFDSGIADFLAAVGAEKESLVLGRTPAGFSSKPTAIPLQRLLTLDGPLKGEELAFREESWLLVSWIVANGRIADAGQYFGLVMNQGIAPVEAFQSAFSMTVAEAEKALAAFDPTKGTRTAPLPFIDTMKFPLHKLTPSEVQVAVYDMALDSGDADAAMTALTPLMQQNPTIVEAHRALAYGYARRGDLDNALEHIHTAMQFEDIDPAMHYLQAVVINGGKLDSAEVDSAEVRLSPPLNNALKVNPLFAAAYELRGIARLAGTRPELALQDLKSACAMRPRNERWLLQLANAQQASDDLAAAQAIFKLLSRSHNAEIASAASEGLSAAGHAKKRKKAVADYSNYRDHTDPKWRAPNSAGEVAEDAPKEQAPDMRKTVFLRGTLVAVECPEANTATLRVSSSGRVWILNIGDRHKLVLLGSDNFSCAWRNVPVGVNYKSSEPGRGDVVSLEVLR